MISKQLQFSALAETNSQVLSNKPQHLNFTLSDLVTHNVTAKRTIGKGNNLKACQNNVSDNRILCSLQSTFLHHVAVA